MLLSDELCELDYCNCLDSSYDSHFPTALQQPHFNRYSEKQINEVSMHRWWRWSHARRPPRENAQRLWHAMVTKYEVGPRQLTLDVALSICIGNAWLRPLLPADSWSQPLTDACTKRSFWFVWQDVIKGVPSDWFRLRSTRVYKQSCKEVCRTHIHSSELGWSWCWGSRGSNRPQNLFHTQEYYSWRGSKIVLKNDYENNY